MSGAGTDRRKGQSRRPGRRAKLTPQVQRTICDALELGAYREVAAAVAGVSRSTFFAWVARGEEWDERRDSAPAAERPFLEFLDATRASLAIGEHRLLETVVRAGPKDWRAAGWVLERRHPARWGRRKEHAVARADDTPPVVLSPEQVAEELAAFGMEAATAVARGPEFVKPPPNA